MSRPDDELKLIPLKEAAKKLGISIPQLRRLAKKHQIDYHQSDKGAEIKFTRRMLLDYIDRHTHRREDERKNSIPKLVRVKPELTRATS